MRLRAHGCEERNRPGRGRRGGLNEAWASPPAPHEDEHIHGALLGVVAGVRPALKRAEARSGEVLEVGGRGLHREATA